MDYRILEVKEQLLADLEGAAEKNREDTAHAGCLFVNLMGSPGAGKTSVLLQLIRLLKEEYRIGVMEADVDSDVDARTVAGTGTRVIQLHTGGLCHMDADMTRRGLDSLNLEGLDIVFLENVGNLVCPAEFDVGADIRVMILSVPEGDDKPLKYPLMFSVSDCMLVNKADALPAFDFDLAKAEERAKALNENILVWPVSAKTGDGFEPVVRFLIEKLEEKRAQIENH